MHTSSILTRDLDELTAAERIARIGSMLAAAIADERRTHDARGIRHRICPLRTERTSTAYTTTVAAWTTCKEYES